MKPQDYTRLTQEKFKDINHPFKTPPLWGSRPAPMGFLSREPRRDRGKTPFGVEGKDPQDPELVAKNQCQKEIFAVSKMN